MAVSETSYWWRRTRTFLSGFRAPRTLANFTDRARTVMRLANAEALSFNGSCVTVEHILLGAMAERSRAAAALLTGAGANPKEIQATILDMMPPKASQNAAKSLPLEPRAAKVIEYANEEARLVGENYVCIDHLVLGILREETSTGAQILMRSGLNVPGFRKHLLDLRIQWVREFAVRHPVRTFILSLLSPKALPK